MGFTRKVLAKKELSKESVFYTDKFVIEIAESIHIHLRNFRLELSIEEWKLFAKGVIISYVNWWRKGKPGYQSPENNWKLFKSKINPVAGKGDSSVLTNDMRIELQEFADYIHFHFRTTKYEFTINEFLEFADEVTKARDTIKSMEILKDYPKRIGKYHIIQPRNRVTKSENRGNFVTHSSRFLSDSNKSYESLVRDENTNQWKKQRIDQEVVTKINHKKTFVGKAVIRLIKWFLKKINSMIKFIE